MNVVPVIDLLGGVVVRGVGGRREEYRPIESILAADARPESIGAALARAGFDEIYVADLDAIAGRPPATAIYEKLISCGLRLWVDAGLQSAEQARELANFDPAAAHLTGIVAGLESLPDASVLEAMLNVVGRERLVFSLDLKNGRPLTPAGDWSGLTPQQIAGVALRVGIRRMIVLDLAAVGMSQGVSTLQLCRDLITLDGSLELVAGGGVRGPADLAALKRAGCTSALVASAVHDGRLTPNSCNYTL